MAKWLFFGLAALALRGAGAQNLSVCPGYAASNVVRTKSSMSAVLTLSGVACNIYGQDLKNLTLSVQYQTDKRLHVQIYDQAQQVYQVPAAVVGRPSASASSTKGDSELNFILTEKPFSFAVQRTSNNETIFNTSGSPLIFESQYVNVRTSLPSNPYLYGLGEDTDPFRLNTTNYTRTLWSRDAYEIPVGTNLYGNHPIYFEHRVDSGLSHGVFLLNSNGMDIKINNTASAGQYLEYNTLGGIVDLYFLAGSSPTEVAQQYSNVIGMPTQMAYWTHGFHQCRYGMQDVYEVADVVYNYTVAGIPLETMWTDIDYMDLRKIFTLDSQRFPLKKVRQLVQHLHSHQQHYIMMVDPATAYQNYSTFNEGVDAGAFMMNNSGGVYQGVVWPGITAFPDWFAPNTQTFWTSQFARFFSPDTGVDIDGLWIDMNEASNFCPFPCSDPAAYAVKNGDPPVPPPVRQSNPINLPGWPSSFQHTPPTKRASSLTHKGLPNRHLINPSYKIADATGSISNLTIRTDLIHANGLAEYDTHNLYGHMMSTASHTAMLARRPSVRPLIITRSTFAGAGTRVGHWLGDNSANWHDYLISIAQAIQFAAIYQLPMVGADVCGYAENTTETLCARWAMLGAFMPFYRNHQSVGTIYHEFYRWPTVGQAAKVAIKARYQLLDYLYTAMWLQSTTGTPTLNPMWFVYPSDTNTLAIDTQFFFGSSIMVSPVTKENATDVSIYVPDDQFYDFWTYAPVRGNGSIVHLTNVGFTEIPVHVRGGGVVPMRMDGANTTSQLRKQNFMLLVAPGTDGNASGMLYLDDGESIKQSATSEIGFAYEGSSGRLNVTGSFEYDAGVGIEDIVLLGVMTPPSTSRIMGRADAVAGTYNSTSMSMTYKVDKGLKKGFSMILHK